MGTEGARQGADSRRRVGRQMTGGFRRRGVLLAGTRRHGESGPNITLPPPVELNAR